MPCHMRCSKHFFVLFRMLYPTFIGMPMPRTQSSLSSASGMLCISSSPHTGHRKRGGSRVGRGIPGMMIRVQQYGGDFRTRSGSNGTTVHATLRIANGGGARPDRSKGRRSGTAEADYACHVLGRIRDGSYSSDRQVVRYCDRVIRKGAWKFEPYSDSGLVFQRDMSRYVAARKYRMILLAI